MSALQGAEKDFKIKYVKDLEMTKAERLRRIEYNDKDIQIELDFLANNLICDKEMKLKMGSQVMCIVNIQSDTGIEVCNGSQGIVTDFCEVTGCPRVKFNNGIERVMIRNVWASDKIPGIGVSQVPLILAWALTIHKSQGATMDAAEIDVGSGIFECGQTYVALSRVKSLDGLYLTSFDASKIRINKRVKEFYESLALYQEQRNKEESPDVTPDVTPENPVKLEKDCKPVDSVIFEKFRYQEELTEEKYEGETRYINIDKTSQIKVIKL